MFSLVIFHSRFACVCPSCLSVGSVLMRRGHIVTAGVALGRKSTGSLTLASVLDWEFSLKNLWKLSAFRNCIIVTDNVRYLNILRVFLVSFWSFIDLFFKQQILFQVAFICLIWTMSLRFMFFLFHIDLILHYCTCFGYSRKLCDRYYIFLL